MKIGKALIIAIALIMPFSTYAYPVNSLLKTNKVGYDVDPRFGSMNDGLTMMRFESAETHGYRREHGYDREDEGVRDNNDRYGYTWESTRDHWSYDPY